ncbi:MAG: PAS domain S-box protein [Bacteroidia bacterium]|nr:PAS domain S-box protein [Bacteroidia bacterium]
MKGPYLLDRIKEPVLVLRRPLLKSGRNILDVNAHFCQLLACSKDSFLECVEVELNGDIPGTISEKSSIQLDGGSLFPALEISIESYEDVYMGEECWIVIGTTEEQFKKDNPFESHLLDETVRNSITDAIIITDPDLNIQTWNKGADKLYEGFGCDTRGKSFRDAIPTRHIHQQREQVLAQFTETGFWEGEVMQQTQAGNWIYVHAVVNTIKDKLGSSLGVVAVIRNITERVEAQKALEINEKRLKLAGKAAYDLLYEWDPAQNIITWYGEVDKLLGYPKGTISNDLNDWLSLIHPDDVKEMEDAVVRHTENTEPIEYEYRVKNGDGKYLIWWDHALPILNEEGRPIKWVGVCSDITERSKANRDLLEQEKLLRIIGENFPKAYLSVIYPDFTVGYTNGQEFKLRGIDPTQFVGINTREVFSIYGEEVLNKVLESYKLSFEGEAQAFELEIDGQIQQYTTVPIENEEGEIYRILSVVRNVTEERVAERKLRESEEKFSKAFFDHPVPMEIMDLDTGFRVESNESFSQLMGVGDEKNYSVFDELDFCLDKKCKQDIIDHINEHGRVYEFPIELETLDGQLKYLLVSGAKLELGKGNFAILSLVDVSLKREAEISLIRSESRLKTLVETLPDLFWLKDPDGVYLACNKRFTDLYGAEENQILGKTDWDFVSDEIASFFRANDLAAIEAGIPRKNEEVLTFLADGHVEHVETIKAPVFDDEGQLLGVMGIARDISTLKDQLEKLEVQNKLLRNIAWMQSHEVRAPLSNIMGLISLMEGDENVSREELEFIYKKVLQEAHSLDNIIRKIILQTEKYESVSKKVGLSEEISID